MAISQDDIHQSSFISYLCTCTLCVSVICIIHVHVCWCVWMQVLKFKWNLWIVQHKFKSIHVLLYSIWDFLLPTVGVPYPLCMSKLYKVSEHESHWFPTLQHKFHLKCSKDVNYNTDCFDVRLKFLFFYLGIHQEFYCLWWSQILNVYFLYWYLIYTRLVCIWKMDFCFWQLKCN